jgi:hypothetical protein
MSEEQMRTYAQEKGLRAQTLERWLSWDKQDSEPLFRIVLNLKVGENHQRDLMDWLEEVALRDRCNIREILNGKIITDIESDPRLGRADKLKRIKDEIRRLRFPRLAQTEDSIRARIRELKLPAGVSVSVPAGLEGGKLQVNFYSSTQDQLKYQLNRISDAADSDSMCDIFQLLAGLSLENVS